MGKQMTVVRGKWNVVLRSLDNAENELKVITQNFDSLDVSLVDRLSELKYSHEDKIKFLHGTICEFRNCSKI